MEQQQEVQPVNAMEVLVPKVRARIIKETEGADPNFTTGIEAWEVAKQLDKALTEKQSSEFIRAWYKSVTRSLKMENEMGKSSRKTGLDKNGNPTNSARAKKLEEGVASLWDSIDEYAEDKDEKVREIVLRHKAERDAKLAEVRESFKKEAEAKESKKQEKANA